MSTLQWPQQILSKERKMARTKGAFWSQVNSKSQLRSPQSQHWETILISRTQTGGVRVKAPSLRTVCITLPISEKTLTSQTTHFSIIPLSLTLSPPLLFLTLPITTSSSFYWSPPYTHIPILIIAILIVLEVEVIAFFSLFLSPLCFASSWPPLR